MNKGRKSAIPHKEREERRKEWYSKINTAKVKIEKEEERERKITVAQR